MSKKKEKSKGLSDEELIKKYDKNKPINMGKLLKKTIIDKKK